MPHVLMQTAASQVRTLHAEFLVQLQQLLALVAPLTPVLVTVVE